MIQNSPIRPFHTGRCKDAIRTKTHICQTGTRDDEPQHHTTKTEHMPAQHPESSTFLQTHPRYSSHFIYKHHWIRIVGVDQHIMYMWFLQSIRSDACLIWPLLPVSAQSVFRPVNIVADHYVRQIACQL